MARGLLYLHSQVNLIYGNLTSSNVLLDENTNAKTSYYGLSQLMSPTANANIIATGGTSHQKIAGRDDEQCRFTSMGKIAGKSKNGVDLSQWAASILEEEWTTKSVRRRNKATVSRAHDSLSSSTLFSQIRFAALQASPALSPLLSKKGSEQMGSPAMTSLRALALLGAGVTGLLSFTTIASADEAEHGLEAPSYPWPHSGILSSYDHASIRRGHQVYQQVCASCHSMSLVSYRDLVGVAYTEDEVKAMAAEIEVTDGPNDEGEMFTRPGKLSDRFPQPYPNEAAARFANGGAYPPDLSLITKARHNGQNYVFALLTGYRDPPAGITIREGLHYNAYFPGGAIAMPKMLIDGAVEYEDGTPATEAQMGKDVVSFLSWAAEPEMEERKLMGFKWILVLSLALLQAGYYRRLKWSVFKSRKLVLDVVN
ncbi:OLC1v1008327C1 [Oldenlandia corymbosa var. corymbosa]|uniref:OLC1v1008327C1 n=1 Tax=Oldenlandia corymbosa var. corymbosa TaxID=529605 RepID=A0AAV1DLB6_OLDCO|nr:OLC1v1008327C1 [Oldenlandia corymbosa var. corymbosa]